MDTTTMEHEREIRDVGADEEASLDDAWRSFKEAGPEWIPIEFETYGDGDVTLMHAVSRARLLAGVGIITNGATEQRMLAFEEHAVIIFLPAANQLDLAFSGALLHADFLDCADYLARFEAHCLAALG